MTQLFVAPFYTAVGLTGSIPLAKLYFYDVETLDLITVYSDAGATTPLTNPVQADSVGRFPPIYVDANEYRIRLTTAGDVLIKDVDNIPSGQSTPYVTPQMFGGVGDGVVNDGPAFIAAIASLKTAGGGTLYIPDGTYANKTVGAHAIDLGSDASNITIEWSGNAMVVNNNLTAGNATSHGVFIEGPASNITLLNPRIRWVSQSTAVQQYMAIYAVTQACSAAQLSYAVDTEALLTADAIDNLTIRGGLIENSPSIGIVLGGVSNFSVTDVNIRETLADGIFLDRCKNGNVEGNNLYHTGDDGISLHRLIPPVALTAPPANPASLYTGADGLTYGWSCSGVRVNGNVIDTQNPAGAAQSASSHGLALYGVNDVTMSSNVVKYKGRGIGGAGGIYSATAAYLASSQVAISTTSILGASNTLHFQSIGNSLASAQTRWFWDISIENTVSYGVQNNGITFTDAGSPNTGWIAGIRVSGYRERSAGSFLWNIVRCRQSIFEDFDTDQVVNISTGFTGDPYGFGSISSLSLRGQAVRFVFSGVLDADVDLVSYQTPAKAYELISCAQMRGKLKTLYPQAGSGLGAVDIDTNSKDNTFQLSFLNLNAQSWAGAVKAVSDKGHWFESVEIITGNTNANAPFVDGGQYVRAKSWRYKALGTDSDWHYATEGLATLVAGTVTVNTPLINANTILQLTRATPGGTAGDLSSPPGSRVAGTSFVINSASATDTSTVYWKLTPAGN